MTFDLRVSSRWLVAAGALALSACQYDLDQVFEHTPPDAGVPSDLIDLWKASSTISDDCAACARTSCGAENTACKGDPECLALTGCIAKAQNPAAQLDCRAQHIDWLSDEVQARDTGGPYQQCVFVNSCAQQCESRTQLSCKGNYTWPTSFAGNVKAHIRFTEGFNNAPTSGITVRACGTVNAAICDSTTAAGVTDENGDVEIELPVALGGFQGYLELEGGGLYPTLLKFGWPIARDFVTGVTVVNDGSVRLLVGSSGAMVSKDSGLLQLRVFGCNGVPQRGLSFGLDGADSTMRSWYTKGLETFPDFSVSETGDRGVAGIINVPSGNPRVFAKRGEEEVASLRAPVRANYMTIVIVQPGDTSL